MITVNFKSDINLYEQIYNKIILEIEEGRLSYKDKLPSKRNLASHLGVSVNTVSTAYELLLSEGYLVSKEKVGYFVDMLDRSNLRPIGKTFDDSENQNINEKKKYKYDFYFAGLDKDYIYKSLQPFSAKALEMTINEDSTDPLGSFKLRKEIAKMLFDYKGIDSSANNILITSGYRENLNIIFSILNEEYYAAEDPCYFKNSSIFKNAGKKLLRIPIDKYGFSVKDLEKGPAKVAITTPSHQFAEGILMGIRRRQRLINWANENYAYIFEDDYDSDFRYGPKLVPALKALDKEDRVIFSGSFSQSVGKIFSISYLCLPDELIEKLDLKSVEKSRISALEENLLYLFLASGEYRKYINRMTKIYKKKRDLFIKYISERRKDAIVEGDELGLFFTLRFSKKIPSDELVQKRLEERGIYLKSVDDYRHYKKNDRKYIVGFGGFEIEKIPRAANSLLEVFSEEENEKE